MWIVLKYKKNELDILKQELKNLLGESPKFYIPKIKFQKINKTKPLILKKELLNDYLFCYHEKFLKFNFSLFQYIKGLKYCLSNRNSRAASRQRGLENGRASNCQVKGSVIWSDWAEVCWND